MNNEALSLAQKLCSTMMNKFDAPDLPPKHSWHYHQGIFLLGMYKLYEITKDEKYYDYIKEYVDSVMWEDGSGGISYNCCPDDAMPSILLFPILERTKDKKYRRVLDQCAGWIPEYFKTPSGGFWHKYTIPNQMWLDGYYMSEPLCVKYAAYFGEHEEFYKMAHDQLVLMKKFTKDDKTGLWHHACDESKKALWCDKETGKSPEFWGRAFGWIGCALVDILDYLPKDNEYRRFFIENLKEYAETIIKYQSSTEGAWYQVLDKGDMPDNWIETSCSCLFTYTIAKGMRLGFLDDSYKSVLENAFSGIKKQLDITETDVFINNICIGTGVGNYEHYINRPRTVNDLHGSGAFLHAMTELARVL